jgi:hypothetical protein
MGRRRSECAIGGRQSNGGAGEVPALPVIRTERRDLAMQRAVMELLGVCNSSSTFVLFLCVLFVCVFDSQGIEVLHFAACE